MIVGTGDIASVLNDQKDVCYFASGVSNSQCKDIKEFDRELFLLTETIMHNGYKMLVYFSTISVDYVKSPYTQHKLNAEELIKSSSQNYVIIRLGNITWGSNPHTFINYLKAHPEAEVRDEYRYMISKEQLLYITDNVPLTGQHEISIFGSMKKVKDCL